MQVSKIIETLQSRYQPDDELIIDWWDEDWYNSYATRDMPFIPAWYDVTDQYESGFSDLSENMVEAVQAIMWDLEDKKLQEESEE